MARLSDADVGRLVASLSGGSGSARATGEQPRTPTSRLSLEPEITPLDPPRLEEAQRQLADLSSNGALGPLLTQRLAAYHNRPVRCTSCSTASNVAVDVGRPSRSGGEEVLYVAQGGGVRYWLSMEPLLASAVADAMIGGEGDALKVGSGSKVLRLAAGAATEMLRGIAAALDLPEPGTALLDRSHRGLAAHAAGDWTVAMQTYLWHAGLLAGDMPTSTRVLTSAPNILSRENTSRFEGALENARQRLEQLLRRAVAFSAVETRRLASPGKLSGWLRISIANRSGGAVILATDRQSAAALVNCALDGDVVEAESGGALTETGAGVILMNALQAFAAALPDPPEDLRHTMRLTDEAILAELPHHSIEHRFDAGRYGGVLHWLIPELALHPRGVASTAGKIASA